MELKFYTVDEDYIQHLKKIDSNVPNNYLSSKPFIGILFNINDLAYIAPLTSAKPKHAKIKNSNPASFKIFDGNHGQKLLAVIQLNNMIPVKLSCIKKLDMSKQDIRYQFLLLKEINYIRTNSQRLLQKATKIYNLVTVKKAEPFIHFSCNFTALEEASNNYKN